MPHQEPGPIAMVKLLTSVSLLLFSQMILLTGHGLQLTLLPLRAQLEGFSLSQIGLTGTAYFVGFTLGCIGTPLMARRVGHIRTFAVLASLGSAFLLLFPLWPAFWPWLLLRFGAGWCIAGLYALMESWLNERASNRNRGMVMAVYSLINMTMIMVGQLLLNVAEVSGAVLFALASILFSVALVPVALAADAPASIGP
jgi:MFS family permease